MTCLEKCNVAILFYKTIKNFTKFYLNFEIYINKLRELRRKKILQTFFLKT